MRAASLAAVVLALLGQSPLAAAVTYHAELIVISHLDPDPDPSEGPTVDADPIPTGNGNFSAAARNLGGVAERLRQDNGYRVLAHQAWTQPDLPSARARPVTILARDVDIGIVAGTVELRRQQVMVAEIDLWLEDPETLDRYRLHQVRRLRSGELHYFDHPRFGVIMEINAEN